MIRLAVILLILQYGSAQVTTISSLGNASCSSQTASTSLTYLVDTTGSMSDDLYQLKQVNSWILDRITAKFPCGIRQYTMVEFNDPTVGPVRVTQSKQEFGNFFNSLIASGGGDCPELAIKGLELALTNSPPKSLIMVLTDASALDYANTTLVNRVRSLINSTKSQIFFLTTGLCSSTDSPDYTIYRDLAALSFGHVFQVPVSNLFAVFNYVDYTLSVPANSSVPVFSGDFTSLNHTEGFSISKNFSSLVITTDGTVYSLVISGPNLTSIDKLLTEVWGFMLVVRRPVNGNWFINVNAGGTHSLRVEGITATNNTLSCSKCHPNATCDDNFGALQCSCKDGFIGDGLSCTDIDECAYSWTNNCPASSSICKNTLGSYTCSCLSGYNFTGNTCVDINECSSPGLNKCHSPATCVNTDGGFVCSCPTGYIGNGTDCQLNECLRGVCASGTDCFKTYGSYVCTDPCSNYTVLNDTWRSTSNLSPSFYNCDSALNGWYRFVGPAGVRMPETCVDILRCNTHAPVWMNGPHPAVSDGIVNRTTCANWGGNCCLWSGTIQVKACPAGYHVYKLVGTPSSACYLSYCADATTANTTCAADEEWKLGSKGYGCYCKDQYKIAAVSNMVPEVTCGLSEMKASFHKCQMRDLNFNINKANIWNSSCYGFQDDNFTNTFTVLSPLRAGQCGVSPSENLTHISYKMSLYISPDFGLGGIIMRNKTLTVNVACVYARDMMTSLNLALRPIVDSIVINTGGTGQFKVSMALYNDSLYANPFQGGEIRLSTEAMLYVGVFVEGGDTATYVLDMKNCYATPTNNYNDLLKYPIIINSCPNVQDPSIAAPENGVSRRGRFSVQMFKFIGDNYDLVYLHCAVRMCDNGTEVCKQPCSGVSSRSSRVNEDVQYLSLGPIIRSGSIISAIPPTAAPVPTSSVTSVRASWTPLVVALLLIVSTMLLQLL